MQAEANAATTTETTNTIPTNKEMTINIESVYIALIAYIYSVVLTEQGMLLNGVYLWCEKRLPHWLFSPVIGCCYCVSGQFALWYYLIQYWNEYRFFDHVLFISATIFSMLIISPTINYIENGFKKN